MTINEKIERAIVRALVDEMAAAGYIPVQVYDGGEYVPATTKEAVEKAVFAVNWSRIHFAQVTKPKAWGHRSVFIVGGNGEDCISEWDTRDPEFDAAVKRACDRAENVQVTA